MPQLDYKQEFKFSKETKNNYVFEKEKNDNKSRMFPNVIYLEKELFKEQPESIMVSFEAK